MNPLFQMLSNANNNHTKPLDEIARKISVFPLILNDNKPDVGYLIEGGQAVGRVTVAELNDAFDYDGLKPNVYLTFATNRNDDKYGTEISCVSTQVALKVLSDPALTHLPVMGRIALTMGKEQLDACFSTLNDLGYSTYAVGKLGHPIDLYGIVATSTLKQVGIVEYDAAEIKESKVELSKLDPDMQLRRRVTIMASDRTKLLDLLNTL